MMEETVAISIESNTADTQSGELRILSLSKEARTKTALKYLGGAWAMALFSIFLPLLHFVLVPGLFLAGPILAYLFYNKKEQMQAGTILCPKCKSEVPYKKQYVKWPLSITCTNCLNVLTLKPKS